MTRFIWCTSLICMTLHIHNVWRKLELNMTILRILVQKDYMSHVMMRKTYFFCICQTKAQISCAVTFVFATKTVQSLFFFNLKFQVSCFFLWPCRLVFVRPGQKPQRQVFSCHDSYTYSSPLCTIWLSILTMSGESLNSTWPSWSSITPGKPSLLCL